MKHFFSTFFRQQAKHFVFVGTVALTLAFANRANAQTDSLAPFTKTLDGGRTVKIVKCYPNGLMRAYCVSFDDGTLGSDWPVLDALRLRNIPATFFINSLHPQSKDAVAFPKQYQGFEIASHGANHKGLIGMEISAARKEIEQDQQILGEKFGVKVDGFAYPYGAIPKEEESLHQLEQMMSELGVIYARGTIATNAYIPPTSFLRWNPDCGFMTRLDKLTNLPAADSVRVMMSFAHSIDFARGRMSFSDWEKQLDQLAADKTIWKQSMREFALYIQSLRALQVTEEGLKNGTEISLWVRINGITNEIPAKTTLEWKKLIGD